MAKKAARKRAGKSNGYGANLGFEQTLWLAADNRSRRLKRISKAEMRVRHIAALELPIAG